MNAIVISSNGTFEATNSKTGKTSKGIVNLKDQKLETLPETPEIQPEAEIKETALDLAQPVKIGKTAEERIKKSTQFAELISRYEKALLKLEELQAFKTLTEGAGLKITITSNDRQRAFEFFHHATNLEVINLMAERAEALVSALYQEIVSFDI